MNHRGAQYEAEADAQQSSQALADAMHLQFLLLSLSRKGVSLKDAQLFLMNGEMPRER